MYTLSKFVYESRDIIKTIGITFLLNRLNKQQYLSFKLYWRFIYNVLDISLYYCSPFDVKTHIVCDICVRL